jgi:hypothetical protein
MFSARVLSLQVLHQIEYKRAECGCGVVGVLKCAVVWCAVGVAVLCGSVVW